MRGIAARRKLLEQANMLVKTNDAATTLSACAALLDALGTLMSEWTGEVVCVRITAEAADEIERLRAFAANIRDSTAAGSWMNREAVMALGPNEKLSGCEAVRSNAG